MENCLYELWSMALSLLSDAFQKIWLQLIIKELYRIFVVKKITGIDSRVHWVILLCTTGMGGKCTYGKCQATG